MQYLTLFFSLCDARFFETLDRYEPNHELLDFVATLCGDEWKMDAGGFWSTCFPKDYSFQLQGWKIHVAGTERTAVEMLHRLAPFFVKESVAFKFCSDLAMVKLSTSKNWDRTSAGKFITVYPTNTQQFKELIACCHESTQDLSGPHILTDRPYPGSRVIFYRYGGHVARFRSDSQGRKVPIILTPDGAAVPDRRVPYFYLPPWVSDPFETAIQKKNSKRPKQASLKSGRYQVESAIRFSSHGGIYRATDKEGDRSVVIREQRDNLGLSDGLEKEARILRKLAGTGLAPEFIDLFHEGNHTFLVQEYLLADSLWTRVMSFTFKNPEPPTPQELFHRIREMIRKIVNAVTIVHQYQIVLRDLTKTNVLFMPDDSIRLIDFELAYEMDRDDPVVAGSTFGYASPQQLSNQVPQPSDDFYALGALLVDIISVRASGLYLNRSGVLNSIRQTLDDLGLPHNLLQIIEGLLDVDPARRWRGTQVLNHLEAASVSAPCGPLDPEVLPTATDCPSRGTPTPAVLQTIRETVDGITDYILATANYERQDRLWPASSEVFLTNPVCIRFGAAGIASYVLRASKGLPQAVIEWIGRNLRPEECPAGLYSGLSGVALLFLELGKIEEAERIFELSANREQVYREPGLYDGAAGWGLVNLHFWRMTGRHKYLSQACEVAEHLINSAKLDEDGAFWESDGAAALGLGSGSSGIALFLVYLNATQHEDTLLELATSALDFEIANAFSLGHRVFMHEFKTNNPRKMKSPHTKYGSAGVGSVALRLYSVTGKLRFKKFAERCAFTVSTRCTNKLWQDWGLSGFGEFLIDAFIFLGSANYLNTAFYLAEGLLPYRIFQPEGIAFPGEELLRISCDFGLGSAGIGMFLYRLLNPASRRFLLLDELLSSESQLGKSQFSKQQERCDSNKVPH